MFTVGEWIGVTALHSDDFSLFSENEAANSCHTPFNTMTLVQCLYSLFSKYNALNMMDLV